MEQLSFNEELQKSLNLAFMMNYLVLDNFRHVDPTNHKGVFSSGDVFGPKSRKQATYEGLYHDYAKSRNEVFKHLQDFFESYNYPQYFIENTNSLINLYNTNCNKNVKVSDVFTDKEFIDRDFLEKFADDLEGECSLPKLTQGMCYMALTEFAVFYEQYKQWLSAYEIFQTLQEDITRHGSKSLVYGKPRNEDVFVIDKESYKKFITPILVELMEEEKHLEKQRKLLVKQINAGHTELQEDLAVILSVLVAIKLIYVTDSTLNKRFESATKKPEPKHKIDAMLDFFVSKVLFNENDFIIDKIYVHKHEILDFVDALSVFPRYDEISKKLTDIAHGKIQDLTNISSNQKENA